LDDTASNVYQALRCGTVLRHRRWCRAAVGAADRAMRALDNLARAGTGPLKAQWPAGLNS
jgi:hypothetical protein